LHPNLRPPPSPSYGATGGYGSAGRIAANNTLEFAANSCYSARAMNSFGSDIILNVAASVIASAILLGAGFLWGKYKERRKFGRRLEEYDFYPYTVNRDNFPEFNLNNFRLGMHYFLRNNDPTAAR